MLETGTKAPDFELPDQNGEMHKLSDYIFIQRIILQDARSRHVAFQSVILSLRKKVRLFSESVRIL